MKISVIIPAYNEAKYLGACLESIERQRVTEVCEVIVVDNGSTDATVKIAEKFSGVRIISELRKGVNKARERGRLSAIGDILAYLDADTIVPEGWFEQIVERFGRDERLVCISGPYRYYGLTSRVQELSIRFYWNFLALSAYYIFDFTALLSPQAWHFK